MYSFQLILAQTLILSSKDTVAEVTANGPFFATVGFSQGANVAAALLAKQAGAKPSACAPFSCLLSCTGLFQDGLGLSLHGEPLWWNLGVLGQDSALLVVLGLPSAASN